MTMFKIELKVFFPDTKINFLILKTDYTPHNLTGQIDFLYFLAP